MKIWNQAPLVRLLIPFVTGIVTAVYLPFKVNNFAFVIAPYLVFIAAVVLVPSFRISYKKSWLFGLVLNVVLFIFAYQLTISKTEKFSEDHFSKFVSGKSFVRGVILDSPIEKEKSYKMTLRVYAVKTAKGWMNTSGKAMLYIRKDEFAGNLKYGDEIMLNCNFRDIPQVQNPGEFDYRLFLSFHNVYQQCSADEKNWRSLKINSGNIIIKHSYFLRDKLLEILKTGNVKDDEFAVGAALMLGYSDKLDAEIISAYSSTGALHVLSVSGLHVAIVYVVFNWLLFFLDKIKRGNIIKAVILILLLWFYSALTGLSPSVLRAATMFSFIIVAKAFDRYTNIYNTLAASAFVLLAINPYLIMEVGFQLSYIAVIGIVYIQPKIYAWYETDNWLLDQVWAISAVSIAAQIATFPLGLHYFHQFPNYFLLSNFIVIPVSTIIIYLGIALFVFSKISIVAVYLAMGFSWSVWFLNASVKLIEKWPYSLLQGISITVFETWLLYAMIILFFYYFMKRKVLYLMSAFVMVIAILCCQVKEQQDQFRQKKIIVYNVLKTAAIDFISAKRNVLLTDSAFANNESGMLFHVKHNWWDLGINESVIVTKDHSSDDLLIKNNKIQFGDKKIVILNNPSEIKKYPGHAPIAVDFLIISKNAKVSIGEVLSRYDPEQIIFDSSNSKFKLEKWKEECVTLSRSFYSVTDSGAFEAEI
jgi:competence protein ComEC